ncbi:MAG: hypothetical protein PHW62_04320 [Candidatus Ratteibacteria bacterium]|nr:hypothetical protein [Candidatus Ratteibacteria bacterium]
MEKKLDWNMYSLVLIGMILLLQVFHSYHYPQFLDEYFHLHSAWSIEHWEGFSSVDLLQDAPIGRPNLYPPFYHSLIQIIHRAGVDWIAIAKMFSVLIVPVFCLVFYFIFKDLISSLFGFIFVLLIFSNYSFFNSLINNIPATISIIFWGLSFYSFIKNKFLASSLFLGLCFYTHPILGYVEFSLLFIWALLSNSKKAAYYLLSLIVASPFIFHQFYNIKYFSFRENLYGNWFLELKFVEITLCMLGIVAAIVSKDKRDIVKLFLLSMIFSAIFYVLPGYRDRVIASQGFLPVMFFAAYSIYYLFEKMPDLKKKVVLLLSLFIFFVFLSPSFLYSKQEKRFILFDSFFINSVKDVFNERTHSFSIWSAKTYNPVIAIIKEDTDKDDVIYSNMYSLGVMFSLLSERPTASALFSEVNPFLDFDRVAVSKLVIHLKDLDPQKDSEILDYFSQRGFELIGDLPIFYIFKNPSPLKIGSIEKQIIIGKKILYGFWLALFCLIFFSLFIEKQHPT